MRRDLSLPDNSRDTDCQRENGVASREAGLTDTVTAPVESHWHGSC